MADWALARSAAKRVWHPGASRAWPSSSPAAPQMAMAVSARAPCPTTKGKKVEPKPRRVRCPAVAPMIRPLTARIRGCRRRRRSRRQRERKPNSDVVHHGETEHAEAAVGTVGAVAAGGYLLVGFATLRHPASRGTSTSPLRHPASRGTPASPVRHPASRGTSTSLWVVCGLHLCDLAGTDQAIDQFPVLIAGQAHGQHGQEQQPGGEPEGPDVAAQGGREVPRQKVPAPAALPGRRPDRGWR